MATPRLAYRCAALLCGLIASGFVVPPGPAHAVTIYCATDKPIHVTWDGSAGDSPGKVGDNRYWDDPYNWDTNCVPGYRYVENGPTKQVPSAYRNTVSIPEGASVSLDGDEATYGQLSAHVAALDNRGRLHLELATLETLGDSSSHSLTLVGSELAGRGRFEVTSELRAAWSALSTRTGASWCLPECSTSSPIPASEEVGVLVIHPNARMSTGWNSVGLVDQRVIENHGTIDLNSSGDLYAENGTAVYNVRDEFSTGRFLLRHRTGFYTSQSDNGLADPKLVNTGIIVKDAEGVSNGVSTIMPAYADTTSTSPFTGRVEVLEGALNILTRDSTQREATVEAGAAFGNGAPENCRQENGAWVGCSQVAPTAGDRQLAQVKMTSAAVTSLPVSIRELPPVDGFYGVPVEIETPGAEDVATGRQPLIFRILLDKAELNGNSAVEVARNAPVGRKGSTDRRYKLLPNCTAALPTLQQACVARRLSVKGTERRAGDGDVVLVIKSRQNSRYRVGH